MSVREQDRLADSVPETAFRLGVCQAMVWKLIKEKKIGSVKIGGRRVITRDAQRAFLDGLLAA
jgi:excisionase family DNA binding protein